MNAAGAMGLSGGSGAGRAANRLEGRRTSRPSAWRLGMVANDCGGLYLYETRVLRHFETRFEPFDFKQVKTNFYVKTSFGYLPLNSAAQLVHFFDVLGPRV